MTSCPRLRSTHHRKRPDPKPGACRLCSLLFQMPQVSPGENPTFWQRIKSDPHPLKVNTWLPVLRLSPSLFPCWNPSKTHLRCPSPIAPIRSVAPVRHSGSPLVLSSFVSPLRPGAECMLRCLVDFLCFVCRIVAHYDFLTRWGRAHAVPAGSWGSTVQSINIVMFSLCLSFTTGGLSATVLESGVQQICRCL